MIPRYTNIFCFDLIARRWQQVSHSVYFMFFVEFLLLHQVALCGLLKLHVASHTTPTILEKKSFAISVCIGKHPKSRTGAGLKLSENAHRCISICNFLKSITLMWRSCRLWADIMSFLVNLPQLLSWLFTTAVSAVAVANFSYSIVTWFTYSKCHLLSPCHSRSHLWKETKVPFCPLGSLTATKFKKMVK